MVSSGLLAERIGAGSAVEVRGTAVGEAEGSLAALLVPEAVENTAAATQNGFKAGVLVNDVGEAETRSEVVLAGVP